MRNIKKSLRSCENQGSRTDVGLLVQFAQNIQLRLANKHRQTTRLVVTPERLGLTPEKSEVFTEAFTGKSPGGELMWSKSALIMSLAKVEDMEGVTKKDSIEKAIDSGQIEYINALSILKMYRNGRRMR